MFLSYLTKTAEILISCIVNNYYSFLLYKINYLTQYKIHVRVMSQVVLTPRKPFFFFNKSIVILTHRIKPVSDVIISPGVTRLSSSWRFGFTSAVRTQALASRISAILYYYCVCLESQYRRFLYIRPSAEPLPKKILWL